MKFDICGIGNPLVDILVQVPEENLSSMGLSKGGMTLIQQSQLGLLKQQILENVSVQRCGDSTANTLVTLALLGKNVAFVGKLGQDELGDLYKKELDDYGVISFISKGKEGTGTCMAFITPDAERTMATYLGACLELVPQEIPIETLSNAKMLYLTGYQLEPPLREAAMAALVQAKKANLEVALDLADSNLITRNKEFLLGLIQEYASFVFANEHEVIALTGFSEHKAAEKLSYLGCTAIVKLGEKGSIIQRGRRIQEVPSFPVIVKDTTGAGDNYAAGFLYGHLEGYSLELCGLLGSLLAAECVQNEGARLPKDCGQNLKKMIQQLIHSYASKKGGALWTKEKTTK